MGLAPTDPNYIRPDLERTVEVYDSLGTVQTLSFGFKKLNTATSTWALEIYFRPNANQPAIPIESGTVDFNPDGSVASVLNAGGTPLNSISIDWPNAPFNGQFSGAAAQTINLDLGSGISQYAIASAFNSATADGSPPGDLVSVSVTRDGTLNAQFSNGRIEALYQIPVATFLNPNGLIAERGGAFRQSIESGLVTINTPGAGGAGGVQSNALESSNVDLGTEFTSLITTQRAYSASSKIITTADEMLEELIRIKR
jgi:flagellar hook protein FlgE